MGREIRNARHSFRCGVCDTDLGPKPWLGVTPNLYTACGCYPNETEQPKMRLPTKEEKIAAILSARADLAEYLQGIGKIEVFDAFTKDEICGLIRAAQEGVQRALKTQVFDALDGEIPF